MSIVLVGGIEKMSSVYKNTCNKYGHLLKVYNQMPAKFHKVIGNPDGMVLFTGTVSHKMIITAVKEAKKKKIPLVRCHSSSITSLEFSIKTLESMLK